MRILSIRVKVNARTSALKEMNDGSWQAQVNARPIHGEANQALVTLLARHFEVRRHQITIKSGATGRTKLVCIDD